jgi:hypothetical protein
MVFHAVVFWGSELGWIADSMAGRTVYASLNAVTNLAIGELLTSGTVLGQPLFKTGLVNHAIR